MSIEVEANDSVSSTRKRDIGDLYDIVNGYFGDVGNQLVKTKVRLFVFFRWYRLHFVVIEREKLDHYSKGEYEMYCSLQVRKTQWTLEPGLDLLNFFSVMCFSEVSVKWNIDNKLRNLSFILVTCFITLVNCTWYIYFKCLYWIWS
jgi:hypothetical protein